MILLLRLTDQPHLPLSPFVLFRDNFTREEAEAFVTEALALAMASDCSSGGCIRLVAVDKDGSHHSYLQGNEVSRGWQPQSLDNSPQWAGQGQTQHGSRFYSHRCESSPNMGLLYSSYS